MRFSFPTAFSRREEQGFRLHWKSVTESASELTGVKFVLNREVDTREAIAATRFFASPDASERPMDVTGGAVTIDIGGGTSDIAVWRELELMAHSSVLMAGRDILQAPLRRNPKVLNEIESNLRLDTLQGQNDGAFLAQLDAMIARHGPALIRALQVKSARPQVRDLLLILEAGLCGIVFYAGLVVARLKEEGKFTPGRRISIFAGGNGSKIFQWCACGDFSEDSEVHMQAASALRAAAELGDETWVEITLSSKPKAEVAFGLVAESVRLDVGPNSKVEMAGESFTSRGESRKWSDSPDPEAIQDRKLRVDRSLPVFRKFLKSIGRKIDDRMAEELGGQVDSRFVKMADEIEAAVRKDRMAKPEDLVRHEPVFIIALKRYLEAEINAWAKRS